MPGPGKYGARRRKQLARQGAPTPGRTPRYPSRGTGTGYQSNPTTGEKHKASKVVENNFDFSGTLPSFKPPATVSKKKAAREAGLSVPTITDTLKDLRKTTPREQKNKQEVARKERQQHGPFLRETSPEFQRARALRQQTQAQKTVQQAYRDTEPELRPLLRKQIKLSTAQARLKQANNRPGPRGVGTADTTKQEKAVRHRQQAVARETNRQQELGNMPVTPTPASEGGALIDIAGDLFPDQPGEIAADVAAALTGTYVFKRGYQAAKLTSKAAKAAAEASEAAARAQGAAQASRKARTISGVVGGMEATPSGRALLKASRFSRSTKGRRIKFGVGGAGLAAGEATGNLRPAAQGTWEGVTGAPKGTTLTTLRGLASIPAAGVAAVSAAAGTAHRLQKGGQGRYGSLPYALDPLEQWGAQTIDEAERMYDIYTSKDADRIAKATQEDYGLLPAMGVYGLARPFFNPLIRHGAARARGIEVPKGEPAPRVFNRREDKIGPSMFGLLPGRMMTQAARARSKEARVKSELGKEPAKWQRRLARSVSTSGVRAKLDKFAEETGRTISTPRTLRPNRLTKIAPAVSDLLHAAAENPLFHPRNSKEAAAQAREGIARSEPGTADYNRYQAMARVPELYDDPIFHRTVETVAESNLKRGHPGAESVPYYGVYEEEHKRTGAPIPPRPRDDIPVPARSFTDAETREAAVGAGTKESYRSSEIFRERKELAQVQGEIAAIEAKARERGAKQATEPVKRRIASLEKRSAKLQGRLQQLEIRQREKTKKAERQAQKKAEPAKAAPKKGKPKKPRLVVEPSSRGGFVVWDDKTDKKVSKEYGTREEAEQFVRDVEAVDEAPAAPTKAESAAASLGVTLPKTRAEAAAAVRAAPGDRPRGEVTELVPISEIKEVLAVDRRGKDRFRSDEELEEFRAAIAEGKSGYTDAITLEYGPDSGKVQLGEGHHRLMLAEERGDTHIAARVSRRGDLDRGKQMVDPISDYVVTDFKPSEIGFSTKVAESKAPAAAPGELRKLRQERTDLMIDIVNSRDEKAAARYREVQKRIEEMEAAIPKEHQLEFEPNEAGAPGRGIVTETGDVITWWGDALTHSEKAAELGLPKDSYGGAWDSFMITPDGLVKRLSAKEDGRLIQAADPRLKVPGEFYETHPRTGESLGPVAPAVKPVPGLEGTSRALANTEAELAGLRAEMAARKGEKPEPVYTQKEAQALGRADPEAPPSVAGNGAQAPMGRLGFEPNRDQHGRGLLLDTGAVYTWYERGFDHAQMAQKLGLERGRWESFDIRPDGTVSGRRAEADPSEIQQIVAADPRLKDLVRDESGAPAEEWFTREGEVTPDEAPTQELPPTPLPQRAEELRQRIGVKRETMGPVKLTADEARAALAELPKGADAVDKRAALALKQQRKREKRAAGQLPTLEREFVRGAEEILAREGHEGEVPTHFPHHDESLQYAPPPSPGHERAGVTKDKERLLGPGSVEFDGAVDYGAHRFAAAISGEARRQGQEGFGHWLRQAITVPLDHGRGEQYLSTKQQQADAALRGEYDSGTHYRVQAAFFDNPDRVSESDILGVESAQGPEARQAAFDERAQAIEREGGGDAYYLVKQEDMDHYLDSQKVMGVWGERLQKLGIAESRALLATSFAWMVAQVVAEGGLLLATQSPYRMARTLPDLMRIRNEKGDQARWLAGVSDTAYGTDPVFGRGGARSYAEGVYQGRKLANQTPGGYLLKEMATFNIPGKWDRAKGGFLRDWYTLAEVDRQFNSRSRNWARGLGEMWTAIDDIAPEMRGLDRRGQVDRLMEPDSKAAKASEAFEKSVDRALGNWTAMTPAERVASHVLIFYPFLRFSVDWALRTYPSDHPVRYAIATSMGQWNAEQLEDFLIRDPSFFTDWMQAPYYGGGRDQPTGFVSFSRVSPGANAITEALGSSKSLWGALTAAMRPTLGTLARGVTKYNQFGEYDEESNIPQAFIKAATNLTAGSRSLKQAGYLEDVLGAGPDDAFKASTSPGRPGALEYGVRSGLFPFLPEDYKSAKTQAFVDDLWQKVNSGVEQGDYKSDRYGSLNNKYSKWFEDDQSEMNRLGLKQALNEPKDIERFLKIGVAKDSPSRAEYKEFLEIKLRRSQGEKQAEDARKQLIKLYGKEGAPLTPGLVEAYDEQDIDTGKSGPRLQRAIGSKKAAKVAPVGAPLKPDVFRNLSNKQLAKIGRSAVTRYGTAGPAKPAAEKQPVQKPPEEPKGGQAEKKQALRTNKQLTKALGDPTLTPQRLGDLAFAAKATGVPTEVLAYISKIEFQHGTHSAAPSKQPGGTTTTSDGTFVSDFAITAAGPGGFFDIAKRPETRKILGHVADPTNVRDSAVVAGLFIKNNIDDAGGDLEGGLRAYSGDGYGVSDVMAYAKGLGKALPTGATQTVKNPNQRPFKGLIPFKGNFDLSKGMSQAKWDTDEDTHGATVINKAINPIVKAWATKYHITVGEGFAPPPSDHRSAEHLVTGTATDIYPTNNDWDNPKAMARFNKGLEVLTSAGVEVLYDGQHGTTPASNHGEGNHAHVIWLDSDGQGGAKALQKLTGMTNQQIADVSSSVGSMGVGSGGTTSTPMGGGLGTTSVSKSGGGGGRGGGGGSFSFDPGDYDISALEGITEGLPSTEEVPSVLELLPQLRRRRRTPVG